MRRRIAYGNFPAREWRHEKMLATEFAILNYRTRKRTIIQKWKIQASTDTQHRKYVSQRIYDNGRLLGCVYLPRTEARKRRKHLNEYITIMNYYTLTITLWHTIIHIPDQEKPGEVVDIETY